MIDRWEAWLRGVRSRLSRSEWSVRRLGLSMADPAPARPGLVLVYVEGLSRAELETAMERGWMHFCQTLRERETYRLHTLDTTSHISTLALHRELFHGNTDHPAAESLVNGNRESRPSGEPSLLRGGSQYGSACAGGASESHDCSVAIARNRLREADSLSTRWGFAAAHSGLIMHLLLAAAGEAGRTMTGALSGIKVSDLRSRLRKTARHVLQREFTVIGAALDVARGLPVVHLSLPFATLEDERASRGRFRGLDASIRRIWRAARHADRRDYDIWIYSRPRQDGQRGFVMVPVDVPLAARGQSVLHPSELRATALHHLGYRPLLPAAKLPAQHRHGVLRVMTYNVHSCLGMDGKLSPARIARVIAQCDPDIVAMQELDVVRARSGGIDQARTIAEILEMDFHFHPALALEEERYGDAVLSRLPIRLRRAGPLPGLDGQPRLEPRGAQWLTVELPDSEVQFINTHLGLVAGERAKQIEALLGPDWLGHPDCRGPAIFCGDLNALPWSTVCKRLSRRLRDVQCALDGHRPKQTFCGRLPLGRIDHVYVSSHWDVVDIQVPRSDIIRRASDHLPLIVDLRLAAQPATVRQSRPPLRPVS
jgi:endonuclease/exonuclease/phosphatase family metal-dependent hydrolase